MDDKKFSLIVLAFVFVVAVPSMIFLFSDNSGSTGQVGYQSLYLNPEGMAYAYQKNFQYGPRDGVDVPIYDEQGNVVRYEKKMRTETGMKVWAPSYEQTYSGQKQWGCPEGYLKLTEKMASSYRSMGRNVEKVGDTYCWYPMEY